VRDDGRRARIMAVTEHDTAPGGGELVQRLRRFAVDEMGLSGCALVLMSGAESASVLADALVAADIARDAVLYQPYASADPGLSELLAAVGPDRIVIHQATGMIAAQLDDTVADAQARLRTAAFASGRSMYDVAQDVIERRVRFDE
jgi:ANTAR domain